MKFHGRLPNGKVTGNANTYSNEWRNLANAVINNLPDLKLTAIGYEPGILFHREGGNSLSMDTEVCLAIAKLGKKCRK